jgi:uncharacterized membrane protein
MPNGSTRAQGLVAHKKLRNMNVVDNVSSIALAKFWRIDNVVLESQPNIVVIYYLMLRKCLAFLVIFPDRALVSVLLRVMARNNTGMEAFAVP